MKKATIYLTTRLHIFIPSEMNGYDAVDKVVKDMKYEIKYKKDELEIEDYEIVNVEISELIIRDGSASQLAMAPGLNPDEDKTLGSSTLSASASHLTRKEIEYGRK